MQGQTYESPLYTVETAQSSIVPSDGDCDGDVDLQDFDLFSLCVTGPNIEQTNPACHNHDFDDDADIDQSDFAVFQRCYSGEKVRANSSCAN